MCLRDGVLDICLCLSCRIHFFFICSSDWMRYNCYFWGLACSIFFIFEGHNAHTSQASALLVTLVLTLLNTSNIKTLQKRSNIDQTTIKNYPWRPPGASQTLLGPQSSPKTRFYTIFVSSWAPFWYQPASTNMLFSERFFSASPGGFLGAPGLHFESCFDSFLNTFVCVFF